MHLRKSKLAAACKLALLLMAGQALAQSDSPLAAADEARTVRVAGHYDNAVGTSDAASQGVITNELIVNRPALRTGELLEFVPGLIVTQHSGDGKANQYFLRGFNLDHGTDFATFVDGMPVNMRTHAHGHGYSDLNFLIPELVQRIDYKKGPYFAGEGDFASAGAARIRLMDKLPQGTASLSVGQHGYARGVLADSVAAMQGTLLYGLELNRNDGPWDSPERVRQAQAYRPRLDRMKMPVLHPFRSFPRQTRRIVIIDIAGALVEQVEHVERDAGLAIELVAQARIGQRGRGGAHAIVFHQRARAEVAQLEGGRPGALVGQGHAERSHLVDRAGNEIAGRVALRIARARGGQVQVEQQPRRGNIMVVPLDAMAAAGAARFGLAGVADKQQFGIDIEAP